MKHRILLVSFMAAFALSFTGQAQMPALGEGGLLYRKEFIGGLMIHTAGWGIHFRYGKQLTYQKKISFGFDFVNIRHPKEKRVFNDAYDDGKGFYYGKINSLLAFRPTIGYRQILFPKLREKGVELGYNAGVGPSVGLIKPVYLEIVYLNNDGTTQVVEEVFDPSRHTIDNIYGRARTTRGLNEIKIEPGVFAKAGLHFEYGDDDEIIKAIEVGSVCDLYFRKIPLMVEAENKNIFLSFYVSIIFGRRYF